MWHEFGYDDQTLTIDTQFMMGEAIMVAPILVRRATNRTVSY